MQNSREVPAIEYKWRWRTGRRSKHDGEVGVAGTQGFPLARFLANKCRSCNLRPDPEPAVLPGSVLFTRRTQLIAQRIWDECCRLTDCQKEGRFWLSTGIEAIGDHIAAQNVSTPFAELISVVSRTLLGNQALYRRRQSFINNQRALQRVSL